MPVVRKYHWTPGMDDKMRQWWRIEGLTQRRIAELLGVSRDAVAARSADLGLCRHPSLTMPSDNLRVPRHIYGPADYRFWVRPQTGEAP